MFLTYSWLYGGHLFLILFHFFHVFMVYMIYVKKMSTGWKYAGQVLNSTVHKFWIAWLCSVPNIANLRALNKKALLNKLSSKLSSTFFGWI